jgi:Domain of unknown function (DU1801)
MKKPSVEAFLETLNPNTRLIMDALRGAVANSHQGLFESIKWNGPSFSHNGEHKITITLTKDGAVQLVIHRGVKVIDATHFSFDDPNGLAKWPSKDRGTMLFRSIEDVTSKIEALSDLFARWIIATA